jgi:4-amino-4-deoxychorismate lyase
LIKYMSRFIESIKLQDGEYGNLFYHEQRMNHTLKMLCGVTETFNLEEWLKHIENPQAGLYKCRIVYDEEYREVEFLEYKVKPIRRLRIVEHDRISYEFKYLDRKRLDQLFDLRKDCDDILIVKRGLVTDSSYANIVFRKGKTWFTPWSALLKGTMREKLIHLNKIREEEIRAEHIRTFQSFKLINAMMEFDGPEMDVSNIVY